MAPSMAGNGAPMVAPLVAGLPLALPTPATSASSRFDRAFWFGDLNYRISGNREAVDALLAPADERARAAESWVSDAAHWDAMRAVLLANDQLRAQMAAGAVFPGWSEGEICFRPTYKFDKRVPDEYDLSEKRRIPAYTDRILWKPAPRDKPAPGTPVPLPATTHEAVGDSPRATDASPRAVAGGADAAGGETEHIRLLRYDSAPSMRSSDHKPVVAEFAVRVDGLWTRGAGDAQPVFTVRPKHGSARGGRSNSGHYNDPRPQSARSNTVQSQACAVM